MWPGTLPLGSCEVTVTSLPLTCASVRKDRHLSLSPPMLPDPCSPAFFFQSLVCCGFGEGLLFWAPSSTTGRGKSLGAIDNLSQ